jgi:hypothetical protein
MGLAAIPAEVKQLGEREARRWGSDVVECIGERREL